MNSLWIKRSLLLVLAALLLGVEARAQGCDNADFEFDGGCITLPNGIPAPGRALRVEVTLLVPVPGNASLFYRPTGSGAYTELIPEQQGNTFIGEIPAEVVTVRGLDVYGTYSSGGELLSFPVENPEENPFHVPTFISSFTVPLDLPAREYRMVSVAADVGSASVEDVLADDFGEPDSVRWRLARFNPRTDSYDEFPTITDSFAGGAAFWLITANGGAFDIDVAQSTNPDSLPPIALLQGENQIGNPYAFPVAWDDVLAASGLSEASVGRPMAFDGVSPYVPVDVLEPWTGYFVDNATGQDLALTVPAREASLLRASTGDTPPTYAVRVAATSGTYRDTLNVMGFAPEAGEGRDRLDLAEPPLVGEHLRVSVLDGSERWIRNVKPTRADGAFWDLDVTATDGLLADGPRRVSLVLNEDGARPAGFGLYVIDRDRGTAVAVTGGTFDVTLDRETPVRHLRLIAGTEDFARAGSEGAPLTPTAFALDPSYPNPFAAQTTIGYRLDARGTAMLEVFDLLGRRVRVLVDGDQPAGSHTVAWNGRDGAGHPVANGVYLVRLRAGDASATRRVSVLR